MEASVEVPDGWQVGTALTVRERRGDKVQFERTSLYTLIDSPVFAGNVFQRILLDASAKTPEWLDLFADRPSELQMKPEQLEAHRRLMREARALFGGTHYDHYDFLLAITNGVAADGLEHHRSSQNVVPTGYFKEWDKQEPTRYLLPHEYTHSWDGKFRRPADLSTPDFNTPMQDSLLWVYEGLTEYWGQVLTARSGLCSVETARDFLAAQAAELDQRPGRPVVAGPAGHDESGDHDAAAAAGVPVMATNGRLLSGGLLDLAGRGHADPGADARDAVAG